MRILLFGFNPCRTITSRSHSSVGDFVIWKYLNSSLSNSCAADCLSLLPSLIVDALSSYGGQITEKMGGADADDAVVEQDDWTAINSRAFREPLNAVWTRAAEKWHIMVHNIFTSLISISKSGGTGCLRTIASYLLLSLARWWSSWGQKQGEIGLLPLEGITLLEAA